MISTHRDLHIYAIFKKDITRVTIKNIFNFGEIFMYFFCVKIEFLTEINFKSFSENGGSPVIVFDHYQVSQTI